MWETRLVDIHSIYIMKNTNEYKPLINRRSRAEGQIRALRKTLTEDSNHDCTAFMTQIKAARSALKRTGEQYVLEHIHKCQSLPNKTRDEQIAEAIRVLSSD